MSDRIKGFYVVLENDIKDEDFVDIENAIMMIKGVLNIKRNITNSDDWMNREQIKHEIIKKIYNIFK